MGTNYYGVTEFRLPFWVVSPSLLGRRIGLSREEGTVGQILVNPHKETSTETGYKAMRPGRASASALIVGLSLLAGCGQTDTFLERKVALEDLSVGLSIIKRKKKCRDDLPH